MPDMLDMRDTPDPAAASVESELLGRVVDGEESTPQWRDFADAADRAPRLWRELAVQQRQARLLGGEIDRRVETSGSVVDMTEIVDGTVAAGGARPFDHGRRQVAGNRFDGRAGWALAACLAGAWLFDSSIELGGTSASRRSSPVDGGVDAPITRASLLSPDEALRAYLDLGREKGSVVGELPGKPVIEKRPLADDGGFDVLYIRQIVERRRVPAMYEFGSVDESGQLVPVAIRSRQGGAM